MLSLSTRPRHATAVALPAFPLFSCPGPEAEIRAVGPRPPATAEIVCADDSQCICPLSSHVTNHERAVMNDLARAASLLATTITWVLALVALASVVLLLTR